MRSAKQLIMGLVYTGLLIAGFAIYLLSKRTPAFAYQSMVKLFCLTNGYSNDLLSQVIGFFKSPYRFTSANGVLGDMSDKERRNSILSALRERGYFVFEEQLPDDICDRLLRYASLHPCETRVMDGQDSNRPIKVIYPRGEPKAVRYEFSVQDLLDNPDVQKILADLSFASIAQDYLGAKPAVDVLSMWWLTDFSDKPDSKAAQYFHFDMDRAKWLKFFIYLTDVTSQNGPHSFVAGSHKTGAIPRSILEKGYARLTDDEVMRAFDRGDIMEFVAPRGTIIAEDTRGLHKGKHVQTGDRLVLQVQFSNSLFGGSYPKVRMRTNLRDELRSSVERFPGLYSVYR